MKKILIVVLLVLFSMIQKSRAQAPDVSSGIYLTANDFTKNKLIEEAKCKKDKQEFKTHDLFDHQSFDVTYKGQKKTYPKSAVYAYRDCDNKTWRFYNNKEYEIVETKNLYIYKSGKVVMNGLTVEKDLIYYFSVGPKEEIKELTVENLKSAFPHNQTFWNMLDEEFQQDRPVHAFDTAHKMYRVNYLLEKANKK